MVRHFSYVSKEIAQRNDYMVNVFLSVRSRDGGAAPS